VGSVRDITDIAGATLAPLPVVSPAGAPDPEATLVSKESAQGGFLNRITGKAKAAYKEGVHLYFRDGKNEEALLSREFWMFIGAFIIVLSSIQIILTTSIPVWAPLV
jgi:hypothetical protein